MDCDFRVGMGYDVHPLVSGRPLKLGGVEIAHFAGPAGHSDGDVVLHALVDALYGAAGMPDIGERFPDTDPAHRNRDSREFVQTAVAELASRGWSVSNVDITILAEQPRLSMYKPRIRKALSGLLGTAENRISVKAKTQEGFDAVGRNEAIACHVVVGIKQSERS